MLLTSCTVTNYYQVFKANAEKGILNENEIVFEDNNCSVYYNLWSEGGYVGFRIYNKTESDLTVHLTKSFFVLNGVAYEYFQNKTFSEPSNNLITVTSYIQKQELTIPPKTSIKISEYNVTKTRYIDCDLPKYPSNNKIKTLKYVKDNSPFVFYNLITYSTKSDTFRLENNFYVSEITNYPSNEITTETYDSACGKKLDFPVKVFANKMPDQFYIMYALER